jgi:hypothetical protein
VAPFKVSLKTTMNPQGGKIDFFDNDWGSDNPVYEITVDGEGNVIKKGNTPAGNVKQTVKGLEPKDGGKLERNFTYGQGPNGNYIEKVEIKDGNGQLRATVKFGADGLPTEGQRFDASGKCDGSFINQK